MSIRLGRNEARLLGAPTVIDALGALSLSLDLEWVEDRIFMLVTCFVDESGMDGPRVLLAGYVARLHDWHGFRRQWNKLLAREGIPYSHIIEMLRGDPPFEGWDTPRIARFVRRASPLISNYLSFGLTVGVNKVHRAAYAANMPPKSHPDSDYGMCARQFFEVVPMFVDRKMGLKHAKINFVFERQDQRFGDAERIFHDLRTVSPDFRERLGTITPGEGVDFAGLQCADLLAYTARRYEPTATFVDIPRDPKSQTREHRERLKSCPVYRVDIGEDDIPAFHEAASEIGRRKRWRKRLEKDGERLMRKLDRRQTERAPQSEVG